MKSKIIKMIILLNLICFISLNFIGCASTEKDKVSETAYENKKNTNHDKLNTSEPVLTCIPVLLPQGTDGSYGPDGRYILFGDWPQTVKDENVKIDLSNEFIINNWTCYKGSDNCYYAKEVAAPYADKYNQTQLFSDGSEIEHGEEYYFKMEPIKWRVLDYCFQDGVLLLAENVLVSGDFYSYEDFSYDDGSFDNYAFYDENENDSNSSDSYSYEDSELYSNNYEYSTVRAYLNGLDGSSYDVEDFSNKGFINMAFSPEVQEYIISVIVDNSINSATDTSGNVTGKEECLCENTIDKVFLLSENEVTRSDFGFSGYNDTDFARIRKTTDYSRATGCYSDNWDGFETNSWWWLRSPHDEYYDNVRIVEINGNASSDYFISNKYGGIVPAITLSIELF